MFRNGVKFLLVFVLLLWCQLASSSELESLLSKIKIEQGVANFVQEKKLKFLKKPIRSSGLLKMNANTVLWQVNKPVESKLLVTGENLWQFDRKLGRYKALASQKSIEQIVQTLFSGQFNENLWLVTPTDDKDCLSLASKDNAIKKIVKSIGFCLVSESERKVTMHDAQGNITDISLQFTSFNLSESDINDLKSPN